MPQHSPENFSLAPDSVLPEDDAVTRSPQRKRFRLLPIVMGAFIAILAVAGGAAYLLLSDSPLIQAQAAKTPAALPAVAPPDPILTKLSALSEAVAELRKLMAGFGDSQREMKADIAELKQKLDHPAPAPQAQRSTGEDGSPVASSTRVRRPVRKPVAQVVVAPPAEDARLLSVDTWDNKPSIALRSADGRVHFAQDGESTSMGRVSVGKIGPMIGGPATVRLDKRDGTSTTLSAREER